MADKSASRSGARFHLFTLLGFRVGLDPSWFVLALLIVWSLATGYFPQAVPGIDRATAWWLGIGGALGLFASIVFHEFAHAMVARQFDLPITGITLFIFGGVAELHDEPASPKAEFLVAIVGPISSFVLAGVFHLTGVALEVAGAGPPLLALLGYLVLLNIVLAVFNLLPAFPLDGGRVLRAAMWWWTGSLRRATRIGASFGRVLGIALIGLGVLSVLAGNVIGGLWQGLIGFFILGAASAAQRQMELTLGLSDVPVRRLMTRDPVTVPAGATLSDVVDQYFYRTFHAAFPVVRDEAVIGCVRLSDVERVPREEWARTRVTEVLSPDAIETVRPETPVLEALRLMRSGGEVPLMVIDDGGLQGVLALHDVMNFLGVRRALEGDETAQRHGRRMRA
jgi:Zn-dependent protease